MTSSIFHGIKVTEPVSGAPTITTANANQLGLVVTAPGADAATFPLDTPVLVTDVRAALAKAGETGTMPLALETIAQQSTPIAVIVRVAPGVAGDGKTAEQATDVHVIGSRAGASYTGMAALLSAEAQCGVRPRILGAPGLDSQAVVSAFAAVAQQLRGFHYFQGRGETVADIVAYRDNFGAREQMMIWPDCSGWSGQAVATAMGVRARLDDTAEGFAKSISNVVFAGATGLTHGVFWDLQDDSTDAGVLNAADVTTIIRKDGYRFWGNRTMAEDGSPFAFEVATRTAQVLQDTMATGLMPFIDRPLTAALIRDAEESINGEFRLLKSQGRIVGGECYFDGTKNEQTSLAAGRLTLSYKYTPCAPLESLGLEQFIVSDFYANLASQLG